MRLVAVALPVGVAWVLEAKKRVCCRSMYIPMDAPARNHTDTQTHRHTIPPNILQDAMPNPWSCSCVAAVLQPCVLSIDVPMYTPMDASARAHTHTHANINLTILGRDEGRRNCLLRVHPVF